MVVHSEVRRGLSPDNVISQYVDEIDADLLVLGRHGTTMSYRTVLGSTADRAIRTTHVPILLVPGTWESKD